MLNLIPKFFLFFKEEKNGKTKKHHCCSSITEQDYYDQAQKQLLKHHPFSDKVVSAIISTLELGDFCGCKLLAIGQVVDSKFFWQYVLNTGKLSIDQVREIAERHYLSWKCLLRMTAKAKEKNPKANGIFKMPYKKEDFELVLARGGDEEVLALGIQSGLYKQEDIISLLQENNYGLGCDCVQIAIIESKIMPLVGIWLLDRYSGDYALGVINLYLDIDRPKGEDLEDYLESAVELFPHYSAAIYTKALQIPNNQLSDSFLAQLVRNGALNVSVPASA